MFSLYFPKGIIGALRNFWGSEDKRFRDCWGRHVRLLPCWVNKEVRNHIYLEQAFELSHPTHIFTLWHRKTYFTTVLWYTDRRIVN